MCYVWSRARANECTARAKTLIEELGEEKGKELFIKQVYKMGKNMGEQDRKYIASQGKEANLDEWFEGLDESSIFSFAWKYGKKDISKDEVVVEYLQCPFAEGFKAYGSEGVEIGEWFCENIDNALTQGYNPKYEGVRESSLNKDGLCRLHWKLKE